MRPGGECESLTPPHKSTGQVFHSDTTGSFPPHTYISQTLTHIHPDITSHTFSYRCLPPVNFLSPLSILKLKRRWRSISTRTRSWTNCSRRSRRCRMVIFDTHTSWSSISSSQSITHTTGKYRCILRYDNIKGVHLLDRNKTPSSYGMVYDDDVYLVGWAKRCDPLDE